MVLYFRYGAQVHLRITECKWKIKDRNAKWNFFQENIIHYIFSISFFHFDKSRPKYSNSSREWRSLELEWEYICEWEKRDKAYYIYRCHSSRRECFFALFRVTINIARNRADSTLAGYSFSHFAISPTYTRRIWAILSTAFPLLAFVHHSTGSKQHK